ncbi:MAG: carbohydrate ABC transporter substrate-binding protein [Devosia sp.]|uniref:ABC transporter substrate-binding protein n=1 Tax=Devosia sp. TaxID=1871048 RepID=UPI001A5DC5E5|nr:ABC transporter substrate-binding protein [Devosia sp.]MBL8600208.1 carbohydrate ABC transporter substrate-binding protein [Devosia sp.]
MLFRSTIAVAAVALLAMQSGAASAREPITMWFWGASPAYQEVLKKSLKEPFEAAQSDYSLEIEFRNTVDNDVRVSVMANQGPDLVYTSGPSWVTPMAKAGKLEPLDAYAEKYGWNDRLVAPALASCTTGGHLYCLPPSILADGMFYNKRLLEENGWPVPKTGEELEKIMIEAQKLGLYASATGNKGWQPVNENYSSIFLNQYVGPEKLYKILTGELSMDAPEVLDAMKNLDRWYKAGFLGGSDYFSLDFDTSLKLLSEGKTPFFFAPDFAYQWAINHFTGDLADDIGWTAFPQMTGAVEYPVYSIGSAFTYSINGASKHKDAAAQVLDIMMSPEFVVSMAKVWPGYWAVPLKDFPSDPDATGVVAAFYASAKEVADAVAAGNFGYKVQAFFPPATTDVYIKDVESMWLSKSTPEQVVAAAKKEFDKELGRGLVQDIPKNRFVQ